MTIFNDIDLNGISVNGTVENVPHTMSVSNTSSFPTKIDPIKKLDYSTANMNTIQRDLKRYYDLLIIYLQSGEATFTPHKAEFKTLTDKLSKFHLTTSDYIALRDALLEVVDYVKDFASIEIYGGNGVYTKALQSAVTFETRLNAFITDINNSYSSMADGTAGKVIPNGSVTINFLDQNLKDTINYIDNNYGVYVDRTAGAITIPAAVTKKPIVLKVF